MNKTFLKYNFLGGLLTIIGLVVLLLCFGVYLYAENNINENYFASLKTEAESFELSLQHSLMTQDSSLAATLIQDISQQPIVDNIRLLNSQGKVIASSIPGELGIVLDLNDSNCNQCHQGQSGQLPVSATIQSENDNEENLIIANNLNNRVVCQSCHPQDQHSLGVMLVEYHGYELAFKQRNLSQAIIIGGVSIWLLLILSLGFYSYFRIMKPLRDLANRNELRELTQRSDEFGEIARKMDSLGQELDHQNQMAATQRSHLNALMSISASINDSVTIESLFRKALGTLQEVTGYSSVAMRYFDQHEQCFRLVFQSGLSQAMVEELACIPANVGFHSEILRTQRAVRSTDLAQDHRRQSKAPLEVGYQSMISIPFLSGDRIMGSMELASKVIQSYPDGEVRWLELVGRVVGSIMHDIELSEHLRGTAIIKERNFIAQEIHDGLVQLLGSLHIWAEHAILAIEEKDYEEVSGIVNKIEANARYAYSSLREEMLGLRDTFLPEQGITQVVREYLSRFQRQWGIETNLKIDKTIGNGGTKFASPTVEIQLLRIIQEGLTNVRKHANATSVQVLMSQNDHNFQVEIVDNGKGFDPERVGAEKLGLQIMQERVASINGKLIVNTSPETGTRLCAEIPIPNPLIM